jgi:hypothetical protein
MEGVKLRKLVKNTLILLGFMVIVPIFLIGYVLYYFGEDTEKKAKV